MPEITGSPAFAGDDRYLWSRRCASQHMPAPQIDSRTSPLFTARQAGKPQQRMREDAMTPMHHGRYQNHAVARLSRTIAVCIAAAVLIGTPALPRAAQAGEIPTFAVDAAWPKPLPNNWILGQVGGITVDSQGHIWVIHRPRSLTDDEKGATLTPPRSKCCVSAPPAICCARGAAPAKAMNGSGANTASKSTKRVSYGSAAMPITTTPF